MLDIDCFDSDNDNGWIIRKFEAYQFNGDSVSDKFIPRPYISVVFHFGDCPLILDETSIQLKPFFIAPIIPKTIELNFHGNMDTFVAHCKPTVFSRIFGLDLSPIPGRSIDLPHQPFLPLWKSLSEIQTSSERIKCFSDFINSVEKTPYCPDAMDMLYDTIIEKGITTLQKDMVADCPASRSTIFRKFVKRTGVSPKTLMRIVRLDYLWGENQGRQGFRLSRSDI